MKIEDEIKTTRFENETHKAHLNIAFTANWLKNRVVQRLKPHSITQEQFNVLRILRGQTPNSICMMDVASRMLDRNSNVTRIIEKLLQKDLVIRQKSDIDKREVKVRISEAGLTLLAAIDADFRADSPHRTTLSNEEAALLNTLLDKMRTLED